MKKISLYLAISLIIVAAVLGISIGYALTPEYQLAMSEDTSMDLGDADRWLDARYINAMAAHHRGAMLLAKQAQQNSTRQEIKELAGAILEGEPKLIAELYAWKSNWYTDTRTVKDPIVANLGKADETFDLRLLNALIAHHKAGIEMTQEVRTKSSRSEVLNNADAVEAFLTQSITTLEAWRKAWYNI